MSLKDELIVAQNVAMKNKDSSTLSILRLVISAIKNEEINKRIVLEDKDVREIIHRQVKQIQDAMVDFAKGGRNDLVEQSKFEIGVLSAYLPAQLSEDEIEARVSTILSALGPKESINPGLAMGAVMKELKEIADGGVVKNAVMEYLK